MIERIKKLKAEMNAVILGHNYQLPEIQDISDYVGDSLELSRIAASTNADVVVFCGVHFMAETAKILSPDKTVLIPDKNAGCPMADMINAKQLKIFKAQHPGVPVVAYVNTSAEVKAQVDVCCTSANAVNIVRNIEEDTVLFVPDKSLGSYVQAMVPEKKLICWQGFCPTHHRILAEDVIKVKREHPRALVVAHPECSLDVVALADIVASTSGMVKQIDNSSADEFIVCTERGLIHQFKLHNPTKTFYNPSPLNICPNMKKITLEKLLWCLEDKKDEILLDEDIIKKATRAMERMIAY